MKSSTNFKAYHLFLLTAIIAFLFYVDGGNGKSLFKDDLFLFYVAVSLLVLLIWVSYWFVRKKPLSSKLIWIHLAVVFIVVVCCCPPDSPFHPLMPRRYLTIDAGKDITDVFGSQKNAFELVAAMLLASQFLLIYNIRTSRLNQSC